MMACVAVSYSCKLQKAYLELARAEHQEQIGLRFLDVLLHICVILCSSNGIQLVAKRGDCLGQRCDCCA